MNTMKKTWIGFIAAGLLGLFIGIGTSVEAGKGPETRLPIDDIRNLAQVIDHVKRSYVEEVDDQKLLEDAIRGMLAGLDPHSSYLTPQDFADLKEDTSGKFGGLGIEVSMDETGFVRVVSPIDDTPAFRAGIQAGDLITVLDDKPVKGLSLSQAVDIMRGEPGSTILLTVVRSGESKPLEIKIKRDVIKVTSIRQRMLESGYGYVRISQFQQRTGPDFVSAMKKLRDENGDKLNGLVLDLRNNPGGVLNAAVDVVDALISEGLIVYTEGRLPDSEFKYSATSGDASDSVNLVVLINGGSASASEIVAGALQDHKRAVIMGTQSFGKGSVQTILPLGENRALKLTTARYYTPSGRSIQAQGIVPDIVVERGKLNLEESRFFKESDLQGHLENNTATSTEAGKANGDPEAEKNLAETDYQLYEALNMLKGMHIVSIMK
ncbi:S41 family peptidase [Gynuella sunshinyii]|uniref:Periplasmic protease n=1 Tax=Gynuella sunshinyii YC6258 TaxID=1445510 RepID=A0A0C5VHA1_9GAMM|nr:S41 family peptidase [Gynuella sunshinyii]AJQ94032.1 periplasmic protease [Gynuella sunshinyii YC6258]